MHLLWGVLLTSAALGSPRLLSPVPGSQLPAGPVTFQWADVGATNCQVVVGTSYGANDLALVNAGTATSTTISGLPSSRVHVRLFTTLAGVGSPVVTDYLYNLDRDSDGLVDELDPQPSVPALMPERRGTTTSLRLSPSGRVAELVIDAATHEAIVTTGIGANGRTLSQAVLTHFEDRFNFIIFLNDWAPAATVPYSGTHQYVGNPSLYGSAGALRGVIYMPSFDSVSRSSGPVLHEIAHNWANSVLPTANSGHWGYAGVGGQLGGWDPATLVSLGGNEYQARSLNQSASATTWFANANGGNGLVYAPLELYLMGLGPASEVPVTRIAQGFSWINSSTGKFSATGFDDWSVARINAALGANVPNYATSQKEFSVLYVVLTPSRLHPGRIADLDEAVRLFGLPGDNGMTHFNFWEATKGRGRLNVDVAASALKAPPAAPVITSPAASTGSTGQPWAYTVTATNSPTSFAALNLPGGLTIDSSNGLIRGTPAAAGNYPVTLQATNAFGTGQLSLNLTVEVGPLAITAHPQSVVATAGQPATFTVGVHSAGVPAYQWRRNGLALPGATQAAFTLASTSRTDADYYDVLVSDATGSVASAIVRLSVAPTAYPSVVAPDPAWNLRPEIGGGTGFAVAPLADGRCYLGGSFTSLNGVRRTGVFRTTAEGAIDPTFLAPEFDGLVRVLVVQPDGRLLVGGDFLHVDGVARGGMVRLLADGTVDPAFLAGVDFTRTHTIALLGDGRMMAGGTFAGGVARLLADGRRDDTFVATAAGTVYGLALQPDGKVLLAGSFATVNGTARSSVARVEVNGALDTTFGTTTGLNGRAQALALQPDGKVVVGGAFTAFGATAANRIARLNSDGTLDAAFAATVGTGFSDELYSVTLQSDGRILAAGEFTAFNGAVAYYGVRLNSDGTRDDGFLSLGFANGGVLAFASDTQGRLVAAGAFTGHYAPAWQFSPRASFARLNSDGSIATGFSFSVRWTGQSSTNSAQSLPGGKTLVTGFFTHLQGSAAPAAVARILADGTLDATFNPGGLGANYTVLAALPLPDGKILLAGDFTSYNGTAAPRLVRLTPEGALDPSFNAGTGLNAAGYTLVPLRGGRVFVGGIFTAINGVSSSRVGVLLPDGALDPSFTPGSGASGSVFAGVAQPDGKIVIGGSFVSYNGVPLNRVARINPDGTRDPAFVIGTGANSSVTALVVQPDGRILVGGSFTQFNGTARGGIARLLETGAVDPSFVPPAISGSVQSMVLQENGMVLLRGNFSSVGGAPRTAFLARLQPDGSLDPGFVAGGFVGVAGVSNLSMRDDGKLLVPSGSTVGFTASQPALGPAITGQPSSQSVMEGFGVAFAVTAGGLPAPTYQWRLGGVPIAGATGPTYALTRAQLADAGAYTVTVTNVVGAVTSAPAELTVLSRAQTVVLANGNSYDFVRGTKGFYTGGDLYVSVANGVASFGGNNKWQRGVVSLGAQGTGALGSLTPPGVGYSRQGVAAVAGHTYVALLGTDAVAQYVVFRVTEIGAASLTLQYEVMVDSPLPIAVLVQPPAVLKLFQAEMDPPPLAATAVGTGVSYQWLRNDVVVPGATRPALRLFNASAAQSGSYRLRLSSGASSVLSNPAEVTVLPLAAPVITAPPPAYVSAVTGSSLSAYVGFTAVPWPSFTCTRDGLPVTGPGIGSAFGDGVNPDRGMLGINFGTTTAGQSGTYVFTLTNSQGAVSATPVVVEIGAARMPEFSLQPGAREGLVGGAASFSAAATGIPTPLLKWQASTNGGTIWSDLTNASPYAGVNTARLELGGLTLGLDGTLYRCVATNSQGAAFSLPARLSVFSSAELPTVTAVPAARAVRRGGTTSFSASASGTGTLAYQWHKDGTAVADGPRITGATTAALTISNAQFGDAGSYAVAVSNLAGSTASNPAAALAVVEAQQTVAGGGYVPGGTVTIGNTLTYAGAAVALGWQVLLPEAWSYAAGAGSEGEVRPTVGTTSVAEWSWTSLPASPVSFSYTLAVPAGTTGEKSIQAINLFRQNSGVTNLLVLPDPLVVARAPDRHSADSSGDGRISLFELTRVIELFNTRNGTARTGSYRVEPGSEDGFAPDAVRLGAAVVSLVSYHTADSSRDGKLSLFELTRVIELFNYRSGTSRTGEYHAHPGSEDGFAPGPVSRHPEL